MHYCSDNITENPLLLSQWEETHLPQPEDSSLYCLYERDQHVSLTSQGKDANVIGNSKFRELASIFCSETKTDAHRQKGYGSTPSSNPSGDL